MLVESVKLGRWVSRQRILYRRREKGITGQVASITDARIAELNSIGYEWKVTKVVNTDEKGLQQKFKMLFAVQ